MWERPSCSQARAFALLVVFVLVIAFVRACVRARARVRAPLLPRSPSCRTLGIRRGQIMMHLPLARPVRAAEQGEEILQARVPVIRLIAAGSPC